MRHLHNTVDLGGTVVGWGKGDRIGLMLDGLMLRELRVANNQLTGVSKFHGGRRNERGLQRLLGALEAAECRLTPRPINPPSACRARLPVARCRGQRAGARPVRAASSSAATVAASPALEPAAAAALPTAPTCTRGAAPTGNGHTLWAHFPTTPRLLGKVKHLKNLHHCAPNHVL